MSVSSASRRQAKSSFVASESACAAVSRISARATPLAGEDLRLDGSRDQHRLARCGQTVTPRGERSDIGPLLSCTVGFPRWMEIERSGRQRGSEPGTTESGPPTLAAYARSCLDDERYRGPRDRPDWRSDSRADRCRHAGASDGTSAAARRARRRCTGCPRCRCGTGARPRSRPGTRRTCPTTTAVSRSGRTS